MSDGEVKAVQDLARRLVAEVRRERTSPAGWMP